MPETAQPETAQPGTAVPATYDPRTYDLRTYDAGPLARAVAACPSVHRLSGGPNGEIVTLAPGRPPVVGVRLLPGEITVHVIGRFGPSVAEIAAEVRGAAAAAVPAAAGIPVHVVIDDLALAGDAAAGDAPVGDEAIGGAGVRDRAVAGAAAGRDPGADRQTDPGRQTDRDVTVAALTATRQAVRAADAAVRAADAAVGTAAVVLRAPAGPG